MASPAQIQHYFNGQGTTGSPSKWIQSHNPATGKPSAKVPVAGEADVSSVVASAAAAFPIWSTTPSVKRASVVFRFLELLRQRRDEVARIITQEHGKTLADAQAEFTRGLEIVEFACGVNELLKGDHNFNISRNIDSWSQMMPLGVVMGVSPFNFPVMVPLWMFPIAIACGNCFIMKPSEKVPSASVRMAELFHAAGLPKGVFNVIHGNGETVKALIHHPEIVAVSSVSSTPVARSIYQDAGRLGKRAQTLGGAKNHIVLMEDAVLEDAAEALLGAAFGSAGERCMAISVAVCVGDRVADALVARLTPKIIRLSLGSGLDRNVDMGPLISRAHLDRVRNYIELGVKEGAELVVDGRKADLPDQGYFLGGSLFDRVRPDMAIYQDEIFGPVLGVVRARSLDDAVELINRHPYANGSSIFTRSGVSARIFQQGVETGMVGINVPIPVPQSFHTFGGWRNSMYGPLGMHGNDGVRFYTRRKTITSRWSESGDEQSGFTMPVARE